MRENSEMCREGIDDGRTKTSVVVFGCRIEGELSWREERNEVGRGVGGRASEAILEKQNEKEATATGRLDDHIYTHAHT
jgi:hypothetical protein